jgi:Lrp/AsnC family leucine-responsive transcriptional regulator
MTTIELDAVDRRILAVLQANGRISNVDLAEAVGLSPSPCHRRVRRIEEAGLVLDYVTLLDRDKLGLGLTVFVDVALGHKDPESVSVFEQAISARPEVMECHITTGDYDYLLRVATADVAAFRHFIMNVLIGMPGVDKTRTNFSLGEVKYTTALPLEAD